MLGDQLTPLIAVCPSSSYGGNAGDINLIAAGNIKTGEINTMLNLTQ
jgi:hypothetical protein